MKPVNTMRLVIGAVIATASLGVMAQGQGSFEAEAFANHLWTDSSRDISNGNLYGGSFGYFLTDKVTMSLVYGEYQSLESDERFPDGIGGSSRKDIKGSQAGLRSAYHFGELGDALRPYISTTFAHESIGQADRGGRDRTTLINLGSGLKYVFNEHIYARAGFEVIYGLDSGQTELMAGAGVGVNYGGAGR
jgi:OmpA-OmpF porin, OOP family